MMTYTTQFIVNQLYLLEGKVEKKREHDGKIILKIEVKIACIPTCIYDT